MGIRRTAGDELVAAMKDPALTEADAWMLAGIAEMLCRHGWRWSRGNALLFRTLATLRTDVPMPERVDDLAWRGAPAVRAVE